MFLCVRGDILVMLIEIAVAFSTRQFAPVVHSAPLAYLALVFHGRPDLKFGSIGID
jgi:hypothetical protein